MSRARGKGPQHTVNERPQAGDPSRAPTRVRAPSRGQTRAGETERWSVHDMPTMPPQVTLRGEEVDEPRPEITSLLPAPPLQKDRQYEKMTAYLSARQVAFIKSLSTVIRTKSGVFITQSELLRAMVDAVLESGIDLSDATCEADLKRLLVEQRR